MTISLLVHEHVPIEKWYLNVSLSCQVDETRLGDLLAVGQVQVLHLGHQCQLQQRAIGHFETVAQIQLGQLD
jgi:hypothetical protein